MDTCPVEKGLCRRRGGSARQPFSLPANNDYLSCPEQTTRRGVGVSPRADSGVFQAGIGNGLFAFCCSVMSPETGRAVCPPRINRRTG